MHALWVLWARETCVCVASLLTSLCLFQLPCLLWFPSQAKAEFSYTFHNAILGERGEKWICEKVNPPVIIHFYIFTIYLKDSQAHRVPVIYDKQGSEMTLPFCTTARVTAIASFLVIIHLGGSEQWLAHGNWYVFLVPGSWNSIYACFLPMTSLWNHSDLH